MLSTYIHSESLPLLSLMLLYTNMCLNIGAFVETSPRMSHQSLIDVAETWTEFFVPFKSPLDSFFPCYLNALFIVKYVSLECVKSSKYKWLIFPCGKMVVHEMYLFAPPKLEQPIGIDMVPQVVENSILHKRHHIRLLG